MLHTGEHVRVEGAHPGLLTGRGARVRQCELLEHALRGLRSRRCLLGHDRQGAVQARLVQPGAVLLRLVPGGEHLVVEATVRLEHHGHAQAGSRDLRVHERGALEHAGQRAVEPVVALLVVLEGDVVPLLQEGLEERGGLRAPALHRLARVLRLGGVDVQEADPGDGGLAVLAHVDGVAVDHPDDHRRVALHGIGGRGGGRHLRRGMDGGAAGARGGRRTARGRRIGGGAADEGEGCGRDGESGAQRTVRGHGGS